jgi:lysophospholipase L1-like esterase
LFVFACSTGGIDDQDPAAPDARPDDVQFADAGPATPDADPDRQTATDCFLSQFVNQSAADLGPDYDQFSPIVAEHCNGTNHQDIQGVERVVFLGDSVTVGSPPTSSGDFYRSKLADMLATRFSLEKPNFLWQSANPLEGTSGLRDSGDFSSCSEWGARTDDLMQDNAQIQNCFPQGERDKVTLVIMTIGGNDLSKLTEGAVDGVPAAELWQQTEEFVQLTREAVEWFKEPGRFPNGVFVIFGNMYEFTDGTGEVSSCPGAALAGFGEDPADPQTLTDVVVWAEEQYMKVAVDTQTDMIFMLENFCGHGFNHDDPSVPCYRGPDAELWFDDTCIHPNPTGHQKIADFFLTVVDE